MAGIWDLLMQAVSPPEAEGKVVPQDPLAQQLVDTVATGRTMPATAGEQDPLIRGDFDPLKKLLYQQILAAAQARPEDVTVAYAPKTAGVADFNPETNAIRINNRGLRSINDRGLRTEVGAYPVIPPTSIAPQDSLSHELLHFLQTVVPPELLARGSAGFPELGNLSWFTRLFSQAPAPVDVRQAFGADAAQHALIRYLLGADKAPAALADYTSQVPFSERPQGDYQSDLLRRAFLRQILQDPGLLQQALSGLEPR